METVQILELFGGIGAPRCALKRLNIPTKAIDYGVYRRRVRKSSRSAAKTRALQNGAIQAGRK